MNSPYTVPAAPDDGGSWRVRAACHDPDIDPEIFFPDPGGSASHAKKVCRRCPVTAECLRYALDRGREAGVWGATTPEERRDIHAMRADGTAFADVVRLTALGWEARRIADHLGCKIATVYRYRSQANRAGRNAS